MSLLGVNEQGLVQMAPPDVAKVSNTFLTETRQTTQMMSDFNATTQAATSAVGSLAHLLAQFSLLGSALGDFQRKLVLSLSCMLEAEMSTGIALGEASIGMEQWDIQYARIFQEDCHLITYLQENAGL